MNCERARELLAAELLNQLGPDERRDLDAHLASCESCRGEAQADRALWARLGELPAAGWSQAGRNGAQVALQQAIHAQASARRLPPWMAAAALAAAFLGGLSVPRSSLPWEQPQPDTGTAARPGEQEYMLVLLEAETLPGAPAPPPRVAEYSGWARSLAQRDRFAGGEKLRDEGGFVLTAAAQQDYTPAAGRISGYFMIYARTADEALALARESPHLKYGGTILVLPVDPI
jgi:hypothetical protein